MHGVPFPRGFRSGRRLRGRRRQPIFVRLSASLKCSTTKQGRQKRIFRADQAQRGSPPAGSRPHAPDQPIDRVPSRKAALLAGAAFANPPRGLQVLPTVWSRPESVLGNRLTVYENGGSTRDLSLTRTNTNAPRMDRHTPVHESPRLGPATVRRSALHSRAGDFGRVGNPAAPLT